VRIEFTYRAFFQDQRPAAADDWLPYLDLDAILRCLVEGEQRPELLAVVERELHAGNEKLQEALQLAHPDAAWKILSNAVARAVAPLFRRRPGRRPEYGE